MVIMVKSAQMVMMVVVVVGELDSSMVVVVMLVVCQVDTSMVVKPVVWMVVGTGIAAGYATRRAAS